MSETAFRDRAGSVVRRFRGVSVQHGVRDPDAVERDRRGIVDAVISGEFAHGPRSGWMAFSATPGLLRIDLACAYDHEVAERIWELQDALPADAEWDWSGIRDSSGAARRAMERLARRAVPDLGVAIGVAGELR